MTKCQYTKTDSLTALILAILMLIAGWFSLDYDCRFGDDYAAYISEGIAISEGSFKNQIHLNYIMHPTGTSLDENSLRVYVWGYPLLLSGIYKIVGFDRENFESIIWYKIPSLIALTVFSVCFFFFLRRRFGYRLSLVLTVATSCAGCEFFLFINNLYSDLVFLSFEISTLLIAEFRNSCIKKSFFLTALLGILLWYTYEVRSTGLLIALTVFVIQIIYSVKDKRNTSREIIFDYCPYLIALFFIFASEKLVLAHASSEISEMGGNLTESLLNVKKYSYVMTEWLREFFLIDFGISQKEFLGIIGIIAVIFFALRIGSKKITYDIVYLIFSLFYFFGTCLMSYYQGIRYLYPVLPFAVLFIGYGIQKCGEILYKFQKTEKIKKTISFVAGIVTIILVLTAALPVINMDIANIRNERIRKNAEAYSEEAKDIYQYIIKNTEETDIIAFYTARSLYLNTNRLAVPNEILFRTTDVDWFLESDELNYHLPERYHPFFEKIYENKSYVLWRRIKHNGEQE